MSEDYEYEAELLSTFFYWLLQIAKPASTQKDTKLLEALKTVALLLPSRLPPNMNMVDLFLIRTTSMREVLEAANKDKENNPEWVDFAFKRRGPQEETKR